MGHFSTTDRQATRPHSVFQLTWESGGGERTDGPERVGAVLAGGIRTGRRSAPVSYGLGVHAAGGGYARAGGARWCGVKVI